MITPTKLTTIYVGEFHWIFITFCICSLQTSELMCLICNEEFKTMRARCRHRCRPSRIHTEGKKRNICTDVKSTNMDASKTQGRTCDHNWHIMYSILKGWYSRPKDILLCSYYVIEYIRLCPTTVSRKHFPSLQRHNLFLTRIFHHNVNLWYSCTSLGVLIHW